MRTTVAGPNVVRDDGKTTSFQLCCGCIAWHDSAPHRSAWVPEGTYEAGITYCKTHATAELDAAREGISRRGELPATSVR